MPTKEEIVQQLKALAAQARFNCAVNLTRTGARMHLSGFRVRKRPGTRFLREVRAYADEKGLDYVPSENKDHTRYRIDVIPPEERPNLSFRGATKDEVYTALVGA